MAGVETDSEAGQQPHGNADSRSLQLRSASVSCNLSRMAVQGRDSRRGEAQLYPQAGYGDVLGVL